MTTYYPSIYKNSHVYSKLNSNSIVITTQSGFDDIVAENNTLLICDENGNWRTDNLINYAKSTDISVLQQKDQELEGNISTNAQNIDNLQQNLNDNYLTNTEVDTKFIDNDELSTSLAKYVLSSVYNTAITNLTTSTTTNLNSINDLTSNLTNNYYTKTNIDSSLSKYIQSSVYNTAITNLTTSTSANLSKISAIQSKQTYILNNIYSNLDTIVNNLSASLSITSGNYVVEGSVYIYINDITLMTPKDEFISDVNWLNSLPILKIFVGDIVVSEILLETNRPLLVLPISDYISLSADKTNIKFTITIPNSANINITIDNILMYKYKITFKEVI